MTTSPSTWSRKAAGTAPLFAALGDSTRLSLLSRLRDGRSRSIVDLSRGLNLSRQGVTKHLNVLKDAGVVKCRRRGREVHFRVEPSALDEARDYLDAVSRHWDQALARLRMRVEG